MLKKNMNSEILRAYNPQEIIDMNNEMSESIQCRMFIVYSKTVQHVYVTFLNGYFSHL